MKTCTRCLVEKSEEDFYRHRRICKSCKILIESARRSSSSEEERKQRNIKQLAYQKTEAGKLAGLKAKMKYRYGITLKQYLQISKSQDDACYLCGEKETVPHHKNDTVMRLAVDHDHSCCPGTRSCGLCIRSLLCYNCNRFMGRVDKSPKLQERFLDYLHRRVFIC